MDKVDDGLEPVRRKSSRPSRANERPTGRVAYTGTAAEVRDKDRAARAKKWAERNDPVQSD